MSLKTNYKDDKFAGKRLYKITSQDDGIVTLDDVTHYAETGDIFSAQDMNDTNEAVNRIDEDIGILKGEVKVNIPVSGWNASAPYVQTISIPGMRGTYSPTPGMLYPDAMTEEQKTQIDKSSNMITKLETIDGGIRVTCKFRKPTADMIISLKGAKS
ncbi:MAG: hypothetical protein ACLTXE_21665 [Enterocloster aldenensis]